jgi:DivIVA domain-containing protein
MAADDQPRIPPPESPGDADTRDLAAMRRLGPHRKPRATLVPDVSNPRFRAARRGYDRDDVDAYVAQVAQVVAELEATRSSDAVVERALGDIAQEASGVLRRAEQAAEELRAEATDAGQNEIERAEADAREIRAQAERERDELRREAAGLLGDARKQADTHVAGAEREAERIRGDAQSYRARVQAETTDMMRRRASLMEDVRRLSESLRRLADEAAGEPSEEQTGELGDDDTPRVSGA